MFEAIGDLISSPVIVRHAGNPVLAAHDVPYSAVLVFNPGVTKYQGQYVMVFRNDYGSLEEQHLEGTNLGLALSTDGVHWRVQPQPCFALADDEIRRAYDPRLIVIGGRCYMCFAVDTRHGVRGGIALEPDGEVKLYYGAADTVVCLASAHVDDLVGLCLDSGPVPGRGER